MTGEQIFASVLAVVVATIASGLTYVALRRRHWVSAKGVVVESPWSGGEDGGYLRKVRYQAGAFGDRVYNPLDISRSVPAEIGAEVELLYHPKYPKLVVFADFPAWKAAAIAWAATLFVLWTVWRGGR